MHEPGPGDHLAPGEVLRAEAELLHQLRLQHRDILLLPSLHRHGDIIVFKYFYLTLHTFLSSRWTSTVPRPAQTTRTEASALTTDR